MTDADRLKLYLDASRVLTGAEDLSESVARAHLEMLDAIEVFRPLLASLVEFAREIEPASPQKWLDRLVNTPVGEEHHLNRLRAAQVVTYLWYTGDLPTQVPDKRLLIWDGGKSRDSMRGKTPEVHASALMWKVAGAHAPGVAGGYFGHWRYPAED